eukprot:gnl/TRDRNA2_/TRDRNA2_152461_c1_seq1.p3 gnl/TRDRNA2_/TRDRNA2_152461_c1~~gnl/TRDRNA2_/TRDRNA2_152461_c1_seq1.p3  ORF type:complete len:125 (-),score=7.05 gnl/TRDRNA2_/TRDRNA2_152461_c1_seq1:682-1056(-)
MRKTGKGGADDRCAAAQELVPRHGIETAITIERRHPTGTVIAIGTGSVTGIKTETETGAETGMIETGLGMTETGKEPAILVDTVSAISRRRSLVVATGATEVVSEDPQSFAYLPRRFACRHVKA